MPDADKVPLKSTAAAFATLDLEANQPLEASENAPVALQTLLQAKEGQLKDAVSIIAETEARVSPEALTLSPSRI